MFSSIRARIVALCVAIVVVALAANAILNYVVANGYNADSIDSSLTAVESGHVTGIDEWVAANSLMIHSLQDAARQADDTAVSASRVASRGGVVISEVITTMGESQAVNLATAVTQFRLG